MPIVLTNNTNSGLFNRLGALADFLYDINYYQSTLNNVRKQPFIDRFATTTPKKNTIIEGFLDACATQSVNVRRFNSTLQGLAVDILADAVKDSNPFIRTTTTKGYLEELILDMNTQQATVQSYTVTPTIPTNLQRIALVTSTRTPEGAENQLIYTDRYRITCSLDSYENGRFPGNERYSAVGLTAAASTFDYDWPKGKNVNLSLDAIDTGASGVRGNLAKNPLFTTTANWTIPTGYGTTGTSFLANGILVGNNGSVRIQQDISNLVKPNTHYAFYLKLKAGTVAPTDGTLIFSLVDGNGEDIPDDSGEINAVQINANSLSSTSTLLKDFFITPTRMPSVVKLQIKWNNSPTGNQVKLENLAFGGMTRLYTFGPSVAIFGQPTLPQGNGYNFEISYTNTRDNVGYNLTFQSLFERLFSMSSLGLQLPYSNQPTISDSLIPTN